MASNEDEEIGHLIHNISQSSLSALPSNANRVQSHEASWLNFGDILVQYAEVKSKATIMVTKSILDVVLWNLEEFRSPKITELALSLLINIASHAKLRDKVAERHGFIVHVQRTLYSGHVNSLSQAFRLWMSVMRSITCHAWIKAIVSPSNIQHIDDLLSNPSEPELVNEVAYFLLKICQTNAKFRVVPMLKKEFRTLVPEVLMFWLGKLMDDGPKTYIGDVIDACCWMLLLLPVFDYTTEDICMKDLFQLLTSSIKSLSKFKESVFCVILAETTSGMIKEDPRLVAEISECSVFLEGVIDLFRCARTDVSGRISLWRIIRNMFKNTRNMQLGSVLNSKVKVLEEELIVFRIGCLTGGKEFKSIQKAVIAINDYLLDVPQYNTDRLSCCLKKYCVTENFEVFNEEYARCVCLMIYTTEVLMEDRAESIIRTKNTQGIDDLDAAIMHLALGRNLVRDIQATGDLDGYSSEKQRAFGKLLFISNLVFGELSSSLLPWTLACNVTASQVEDAVVVNALMAYDFSLTSVGRDIDAGKLITLREKQQKYKVSDELAKSLFRKHTLTLVEENISAALSTLQTTQSIKELDKILDFNSQLIKFGKHPDSSRFARGLGPIFLQDGERKTDDVKVLYRTYVLDSLSRGRVGEDKCAALNQLGNIFGICGEEAEVIIWDSALERLDQINSAGHLKADASQADFPNKPQSVIDTYRHKLLLFASKGKLSDMDVVSLERSALRIPRKTVEAAHADICGGVFERVLKKAIASGVDRYDADIKQSVRRAVQGLRLTRVVAMSIASKEVRKIFFNHIQQSQASADLMETAKELDHMVAFVISLVADIEELSPALGRISEDVVMEEGETEDGEWESLPSLKKVRQNRWSLGNQSQSVINLEHDLPEKDRKEIYKKYLMYCLREKVTSCGAEQTDDSEYFSLSLLGVMLALTNTAIVEAHKTVAEHIFWRDAGVIITDPSTDSEKKIDFLNDLQTKSGLPLEYCEGIIRCITIIMEIITRKMSAAHNN